MRKYSVPSIILFFLLLFSLTGCAQIQSPLPSLQETSQEETSYDPSTSMPEVSETSLPKESILPAASSKPEPAPLPSVRLVMVGDMLLHTPVEKSCQMEDGTYDYDSLFVHTKEKIEEADLALVNQEVIIGGEDLKISGYPAFNAPFSLCDSLVNTGFDVICHATNHALDKGKKGLVNCVDNWSANYPEIAVLGIHSSNKSSEETPYLYTVEGPTEEQSFRIAILNYTYGTNGVPLPKDLPDAVDLLDETKVLNDLKKANELADFVIVCPHWGTEYRLTPDSSQKKWTQLFLENGVDLVLGTHPHVIEPIEWIIEEKTGNKMLVYYSLGNYINWTSGTGSGVANRMVGGMADVTLSMDETGEVAISDYGVTALVSHVEEGPKQVTTYFLSEYPEEKANSNAILAQDNTFSLEYCKQLCDEVWGDLWE